MVENAFGELPELLGNADSLSEAKVVALFVHALVEQGVHPPTMRLDMPLGVGEQTMYPDIGFLVKDQQNWMEVKYFKAGAGPTTANGGNFLKDMFRLAGFKQDTPEPICWFLHVYDGEPTSLFTDTELWQDRFLKNGRAEVGFTFEGLNRTTQTILKGLRWQGEKRFVIQNIRSEPTRRRVLVLTKLISFS